MRLGTIVLAALAALADPSRAAPAPGALPEGAQPGVEPAAKAVEGNIEHRAVERSVRGNAVVIRAKVGNPSRIFAPLVFARTAGTLRYGAYSMVEQGARGFVARLPASLLNEGSFEYFIEARHDEGDASRFASPARPIVCVAYDLPPRPVKATFRTVEPGATVKIDDNDVGKTPVTVALGPGPHVVQVIAPDGRSTEQHLDVKPGKKLDIVLALPALAGGPSSLTVTAEPEQARVFIDGAAAGVTPYNGELSPGNHTVAVESTGRLRQERQVVGRPGRDVQLAFVLPAMPKDPALTIESDPVGATVTIDGKERGRTPFLAPLSPGHHEVVLRAPGRRDLAIEFAMPRDKDLSLKKEMAPASARPRVTIASIPEDAALAIDGKDVGPSPWSAELRPGEHTVQVRRSGYFGSERTFAVQTRDLYLWFPLERVAGPGQLRVETDPPDAEVSIDGQKPLTAPFTGELSTGDHTVEVSSVGYRSIAQQITMSPGQQISLRLTLSAATGGNVPPIVGVNSAPEGAMLYLDGKPVGPTPRKALTTAGPHELRLVLEGYRTWTAPTRVPDKPGYELRVAVVLKPVREAEEVATPDAMGLARAQYKRAEACYAAQDYTCAAAGYRAAYEQSHRPELLFNIGQAERHQGNMQEALDGYQGFLRDKKDPNPKIKLQAEQYIAFCLLALRPGAAGAGGTAVAQQGAAQVPGSTLAAPLPSGTAPGIAPPLPPIAGSIAPPLPPLLPEENVPPPVLTHVPVLKAPRATDLKITARIIDEGYGIGEAQACYRNLLRIDYECIPLAEKKPGDYEAVVPANALVDGFAYYLEARDSLGRGPGRSGSPNAPHSVALLEQQTAVSQAFAEALAPVAPGEAVPAGFREGQRFDVRRPPGGMLQAAQDRRPWTFRAVLGGESTSEVYTQGTPRAYTALQASRDLPYNFVALLKGEWRSASQPYVLPALVDPNNRESFKEQRYDVRGLAGYELADLIGAPPGRVSVQPMLGLHYLALRNDFSPVDYLGMDLALRSNVRILPLLEGRLELAYTFPLAVSDSVSPLGHPLREFFLHVGAALPFGNRYAVELSYQGDFLAFTYVTRSAHGAALGFDTSF